MPAKEPRWLALARQYLGEHEITGSKHNPLILRWWAAIRAPYTDDETPWCAAFVGGVLEACGIRSSRSAAARSYLHWGQAVPPTPGCIVVFERGPRNGHVGFLVGFDERGRLLVLGGNQGNAVTIAPYPRERVLGYRWPPGEAVPEPLRRGEAAPGAGGKLGPTPAHEPAAEPQRKERKERPQPLAPAAPRNPLRSLQAWLATLAGSGAVGAITDWRVALALGAVAVVAMVVGYILRWHWRRARS